MRTTTSIMAAFFIFAQSLFAPAAMADSKTLCVYDPAGKTGDYYKIMDEFAMEASAWGVEVNLTAYTDEETAKKDFMAKRCDGVVATGVRLQRLNTFPSTIEAMGALPDYDHLKQVLLALAKYDTAAKDLEKGEYTTIGFIPVGAVYLYVRDRNITSASDLAGKRIATMDYDKAAPVLVKRLGGVMVPADLGSIGPKFNNADVDACYMTASGYVPFELSRGLENGGGIVRFPLAQGTLQVLLRNSAFSVDFRTKARKAFYKTYDKAYAAIQKAESGIPEKYWIDIPAASIPEWESMFLEVRLELRDTVKAYHPKMLSALRNIRCMNNKERAECAAKRE